jgi:tetratricopeptide (TPR) repeat protein
MKSLGSITIYYPFFGDETIARINDIMRRAETFHDIVMGLVDESTSYSMNSDIGILATIFSTLYPDTWHKVITREEKNILAFPLKMYIDGPSLSNEDQQKLQQSLQGGIDTEPEDWILLHLYLVGTLSLPNPEAERYIEQARKLVESNPDFRRFLPSIMQIEAYGLRNEGDVQGVFNKCDEALKISREYDDFIWTSRMLITKANTIKDFDPHRALEILDDVYSHISEITGREEANYIVAQTMALPYYAMGEYDMALELLFENYKEYSKLMENVSLEAPLFVAVVIARVYNDLGMPKEALDWLHICQNRLEFQDGLSNSITAHTYILLQQLDKAAILLEKVRQYAFQSGFDSEMINYQFVQGMYYLTVGDIPAAADLFEQSLNLSDPHYQVHVNKCLKALTRVEMAKVDVKAENDAETSGPWMTRLKKHAHEKNYLGIMMEHALLKAEYQVKIGEYEAAKQTLTDALEITDSVTVKTLRKRITDKLKELNRIHVS